MTNDSPKAPPRYGCVTHDNSNRSWALALSQETQYNFLIAISSVNTQPLIWHFFPKGGDLTSLFNQTRDFELLSITKYVKSDIKYQALLFINCLIINKSTPSEIQIAHTPAKRAQPWQSHPNRCKATQLYRY